MMDYFFFLIVRTYILAMLIILIIRLYTLDIILIEIISDLLRGISFFDFITF